jgi:hypothetical protein
MQIVIAACCCLISNYIGLMLLIFKIALGQQCRLLICIARNEWMNETQHRKMNLLLNICWNCRSLLPREKTRFYGCSFFLSFSLFCEVKFIEHFCAVIYWIFFISRFYWEFLSVAYWRKLFGREFIGIDGGVFFKCKIILRKLHDFGFTLKLPWPKI